MNVKKGLKKVFAVGASAAVASLTLVGAFAYDLSDYPAPFVEDGMFNGAIVVGTNAATSDVLGSIDIAASLQSAATTPVSDAGSTSVSVTGESVEISGTSNDLNYGDNLDDVETKLTDSDLPNMLGDRVFKDDDNNEYDYSIDITLGDDAVEYNSLSEEDYFNEDFAADEIPTFYIDWGTTGDAYTIAIDFDDAVSADLMDNSEAFEVAGSSLTFDPDMASTDDELVLFKSDDKVIVGVGEEITVDGSVISVLGANTDYDEATIIIDGTAHQVQVGDTVGDFYISEIFMQTIPVEAAQVEIFTGSDEIAISLDGTDEVELNGQKLDGVYATYNAGAAATLATDMTDLTFIVKPGEFDDDDAGRYLELGEELLDPLFGTFKIQFVDMDPALKSDAKDYVEVARSSDNAEITFTNREGDEFTIAPVVGTGTVVNYDTDWLDFANVNMTDVVEDTYLVLQEGDSATNYVTKIYQVADISDGNESATIEVELEDVSDGSTKVYENEDQIGDADAFIKTGTNAGNFSLVTTAGGSTYVSNDYVFYTEHDVKATLADAGNNATLTMVENQNSNIDETGDVSADTLTIRIDSTTDNDIEIAAADFTTASEHNADDDIEYAVSAYGTYFEREADDDTYVKVWIPVEEQDFMVYFSEMDSTATTMTSTAGYAVNNIEVGLGVLDTDVTLGSKPLIVVGGPYVNDIAAELLGAPTAEEIAATFEEGKALIKWYEADQAMLVAGWSADDTRAACYVVAQYDDYAEDLVGTEVEVITAEVASELNVLN